MANWTIRRAEEKDAAALADCIDAACSIYETKIIDLPAVSDGIAEEIKNNLVWVAVQHDQIVGGIVLIPKADHVEITNVAVAPGATGTGLGRVLMDLAETETRRLGLGTLRLTTYLGIPENVRLYEYLGWHETERSGSKVKMAKLFKLQAP